MTPLKLSHIDFHPLASPDKMCSIPYVPEQIKAAFSLSFRHVSSTLFSAGHGKHNEVN